MSGRPESQKGNFVWQAEKLLAPIATVISERLSPRSTGLLLRAVVTIITNRNLESISLPPFPYVKNLRYAMKLIQESQNKPNDLAWINHLAYETLVNFMRSQIEISKILNSKNSQDQAKLLFHEPIPTIEQTEFLNQRGIIVSFHSGNQFTTLDYFNRQVKGNNKTVAAFMEKQPGVIQTGLSEVVDRTGITPIYVDEKFSTEALNKIDFIVMQIDRPPVDNRDGIEVNFFGKPAIFPKGLAILALRQNRPILPAAVVKTENGYEVVIGSVQRPNSFIGKNLEARMRLLTQSVIGEFEKMIKKYPTSFYLFPAIWLDEKKQQYDKFRR